MEDIQKIVRLTNRRAEPMERLLQRTCLSTKAFQAALAAAPQQGYEIHVNDGYVYSQVAVKAGKTAILGDTKPGRKFACLWTDTHFGCKHSDEDAMIQHLTKCWEAGARVAVHSGDMLDGNKPVLLADQKYIGFESQTARLQRVVKKSPPYQYFEIDGNHDGYYSASVGAPSGLLVERQLRAAGVKWIFGGMCEGRAKINGANWFLWHPHGGSGTREGVRRILEAKARILEEKVDIIVMGHLHKFVSFQVYPESVQAICGGTFQRMHSEFTNRMCDPWDVGGALVSWDLDKRGNVSAVAADFMAARAG